MTLESKSDITNAAESAREEELLASKMTHTPVRKTHRKLKIVLVAVLAVVVAGAIGFGVYVGDYYHADDAALTAMESTDTVAVQRLEGGDIAFVPGDPRAGIVFYPGGKVQAEAYAPLMRDLADRGFLCVIVPMPFNLAVLDANGADGVREWFPAVRRWILMGHSLGGVMAAGYLDGHARSWTASAAAGPSHCRPLRRRRHGAEYHGGFGRGAESPGRRRQRGKPRRGRARARHPRRQPRPVRLVRLAGW